ncbi:ABC transporter substrate-binding protein [Paenibacillus harenae]|uniref:Iron complex transport system substrate-binding protein n=1 Tax=Paenibacillus harenae TaxID=306543 RepID=A0ABT9U2K2_PAEHA|nr:ABC transporter substrate-binding protein [Paenibacillus harenae]MDQ0113856.1 iron complex transport system substrate-binding protein [Paenibacillus harenae]
MFKSSKFYALLVFTLAVTLVLGACGQTANNSGGAENTATTVPASAPAATGNQGASGEGETVTFKAGNGDIQVPKNPQRIVDTTAFYTGYFVALGAPLVGAPERALTNPYLEGKVDGVESLGDEPSPEQILALNPDLIIAYTGTEGLDKLAEIAPVVAVEYGKLHYKDQMLDFGKLTGKEAKAKAWVEEWEKKINELKPQVQAAVGDKTVSILNPYSKGLYVFGHNFGRGGEIIYGEFGLKAPPEAQKESIDSGTGWASISLEKLPDFAGDIVFTCPWSGDTSDPKIVYDNAIWTSLPAVKAGNVFQLNPAADTYNDPVSLEAQLEFITTSLLSAK